MAELKNRPPPGPYRVDVTFIDGSTLAVISRVDGPAALEKFKEHVAGIGARVGTTRKVTVFEVYNDGTEYPCQTWIYAKSGVF